MRSAAAARMIGPGPARGGFTLIELALSLALVVMLVAVVAVSVGQSQARRRFTEVAGRFETVFRMARAEAQSRNRRFRIAFGDDEAATNPDEPTAVRVLWEPEHLTEPGVFVPYPLGTWTSYVPDRQARVLRCRLIGTSAYRMISSLTGRKDDDPDALQAVTCYPDGWSDSALLELAPVEPDSLLRAAVRLDGASGGVEVLILGQTELEENHDAIEQGTYDPDAEEDR